MKKDDAGKKEVRIIGMINALEWDDDDNITVIEISTEDEDYVVEPDGTGKKLFDYVGEDVEAVGKISSVRGQNDRIKVSKFEVMEYDDDEEEDYDDDGDYDDEDEDE